MVYRGVSSPHKKLVISLWFALSLSLLKIVTLESPPRVFAPPSPTGMTTVTRHLTWFPPTPSPTKQTSARLFIFSF